MESSDGFIPDRVRTRLLAAGIPTPMHDAESLKKIFPAEFNISATSLSPEDLASALAYLVERNIISVPGSASVPRVKRVKPGWHFCQFYRTFPQLVEMVALFVAEGLKNGEACFWVMPDAVTPEMAYAALARHVDSVEPLLASGQLEVMSHTEWYLGPSGKLKSFEEIAGGLIAKQDLALARGFKFLRAAGDGGWVSGTEQSRAFIDYEMKVNAALGATQVAAICTYRADVTADELVAIVAAHQDALYRH